MCTSATFLSTTGDHFLARTMDFAFELHGRPVVIPREQHFAGEVADYQTQYGFVGTGRNVGSYILVDGVNEHGMSAAALYFRGEASYATDKIPGKVNVAPHEVLNWILGNATDCADLETQLSQLNIVAAPVALLQVTVPLHWIVADTTGACYVLEIRRDGMHYQQNPVGVMTNSPDFDWQLTNLGNYVNLQAAPQPVRQYGKLSVSEIGPGSGALGMPGDYTSTSRFVRAAFLRANTDPEPSEQAINALCHILNAVEIPKGVKLKADGSSDYTQYRSYFDLSQRKYYLQPYHNQTMYAVTLTEERLTQPEPSEFSVPATQQVVAL